MYPPHEIEKKWQRFWQDNATFKTSNDFTKPKYYCLDMFPYPSGAGLHVGHPLGYTANDIIARYKHANGFNVLHPMGWDAFGLPAENYAIKTGTHPKKTTEENIHVFKTQIQSLGFSYDWDREIDTTDPKYYQWTQWIFLKMFEAGLAYEQDLPINFCPSCKTGLANEEVLSNGCCDRCGTEVEKKKLRQWVLAITKYADRLEKDVDALDWPEGIKGMQKKWIGKSEGCEFKMERAEIEDKKNEACISNGVGLNCPAKASLASIIGKNIQKVKKKTHFFSKIEGFVLNVDKKIIFHSENILKHFGSKSTTEFHYRKNLMGTVLYTLDTLPFDDRGIGHFIFKKLVIKVVLGKQSNGNFFVKTYYVDDTLTKLYQQHSSNQSSDHLSLSVYTTRIDTVFGMTYVVMAPDHSDVEGFITPEQKKACEDYIKESKSKSDVDRTATKEKTGVFTGSFVINPFNQEKIPVYIGDYVLGNYGTGAVMAVPAHDERDFEFAKKYNLKIVPTIFPAQYRDLTDKQEDENLSDEDYDTIRSQIITFEDDFCTREAFTDDGYLYNIKVEIGDNFEKDLENAEFMFFEFTGLSSEEAREKLTQYAQEKGFGTKKVNYKLRDWLFSRQRYWGEPIPLIHLDIEDLKKLPHISDLKEALDPKLAYILKRAPKDGECSCDATTCGGKVRELIIGGKVYSKLYDGLYTKIVIDYNLPLKLPEVQNYAPSPEGHSPLSNVPDFVNVRLADNLSGKRETNTMPQWGGSCWYYLRFMDNHNDQMLVDPEVEKYWGQVDSYVGGTEHAVLHLLYARFWHKFLFDMGIVSTSEPFQSLKNQGMILAYAYQTSVGGLVANDLVEERDGQFFHKETQEPLTQVIAKMSKSLKNVVNPDVIVKQYGADTLRLFEMYMSDFKDSAPWDTKNIIGVYRFLEKATALFEKGKVAHNDKESIKLLHKTIKKVSEDIENYKFNTAIASLMILVNYGHPADESLAREWKGVFARLLHPFAPHLAEELWESLGEKESIFFAPWARYDLALCIDDTVVIGIQVLGKVRGELEIAIDESKDSVLGRAKEVESVKKWLEGQTIVKEVYVPGKIVNFVVKPI